MDGFGINPEKKGNAIAAANTPNLDRIFTTCPTTKIGASGMDVGLPDGQMGNSEVGHTNIGAGRIVYQELTRITKSVSDGDFYQNPAFNKAIENCCQNGSALHLMGLLSSGGVHSHNTHLYALLELARRSGLEKVYVHCFLDGRQSYCILVTGYKLAEDTRKRLEIMVRTNDGFEIAEADLKLRGPGDLEGTQQSGIAFDLKIADIARDGQLLQYVREVAQTIVDKDPNGSLPENEILWRQLKALRKTNVNWAAIS